MMIWRSCRNYIKSNFLIGMRLCKHAFDKITRNIAALALFGKKTIPTAATIVRFRSLFQLKNAIEVLRAIVAVGIANTFWVMVGAVFTGGCMVEAYINSDVTNRARVARNVCWAGGLITRAAFDDCDVNVWIKRGDDELINDQKLAMLNYSAAVTVDPKAAEAHMHRGKAYKASKEFAAAIGDFVEAARLDPHRGDADFNRGLVLEEQGKIADALEAYSDALKIEPSNVKLLTARGNAYGSDAVADYDNAIKDYSAALKLDPMNAKVLNDRGLAYENRQENGDDQLAIEDYSAAIREDGDFAYAYNNRGIVVSKSDPRAAIDDFNAAIARDPNFADAFANRGDAYRDSKVDQCDKAIVDYTKAVEQDARSAGAYFGRAYCYVEFSEREQEKKTSTETEKYRTLAIADYTRSIDLKADYKEAINNRGNLFYDRKMYDAAIDDYTRALAIDDKFVYALNNRGNAYRDRGDTDDALTDYNKALDIDPTYALAFRNRGLAYANKEEHDRAISDYDQAIRLDPQWGETYGNRGYSFYKKGEFAKSVVDFSESIRLLPNEANFYNSRGAVYYALGEYDKAIDDYKASIDRDPRSASPWSNRGNAYLARGDVDSAIANYNEAIDLDPNFIVALNNRANASLGKGDADAAKRDYDRVLALDRGNADALAGRSFAQSQKGEFDRAIADAAAIQNLPSGDKGYGVLLDTLYSDIGYNDKALDELNTRLAAHPSDDAYAARCLVRLRRGEIGNAIKDCDEAIKINPISGSDFLIRCEVYAASADKDRALADCNSAIKFGASGRAYAQRGLVYLLRDEIDKAIEDAKKAAELDSKGSLGFAVLAIAYAESGDADRGGSNCDMARNNGDNFLTHVACGVVYLAKNDKNDALPELKAASLIAPRSPIILEAIADLRMAAEDYDGAIADISEAIRIAPKPAGMYAERGVLWEIRRGVRQCDR